MRFGECACSRLRLSKKGHLQVPEKVLEETCGVRERERETERGTDGHER